DDRHGLRSPSPRPDSAHLHRREIRSPWQQFPDSTDAMSTDTQQILAKAWNFAPVLADDGLSYMAYTEQITMLLFLKMADEQTRPPHRKPHIVPKELDWPSLLKLEGDALE